MTYDEDGMKWLLNRIKELEAKDSVSWWPTTKTIWAGCYDVWYNEQERLAALDIPKIRMKEAEDLGFIKSEIRKIGKYDKVVWVLTELGQKEVCDGV